MSDAKRYTGHLEYSSLMPNPEQWVRAADYDALAAERDAVSRLCTALTKVGQADKARIAQLEALLRKVQSGGYFTHQHEVDAALAPKEPTALDRGGEHG